MKCYKISILLFCAVIFTKSYSQTPAISSDTIVVNLTVTNQDNKNLETEVFFKSSSSHKTKIYRSNKEGKVNCILSTGESYQIKIPNSDDSYEYSIPDFSISPLQLTFKFSRKENSLAPFGIRFLNNNPAQRNFILKSKNSSTPYKVTNDTAHIESNVSEKYAILINDLIIENNSIIVSDSKSANYILNSSC